MLLKAYRSVFSSAWFRGMAAGAVLTAGLSAGMAQAVEPAAPAAEPSAETAAPASMTFTEFQKLPPEQQSGGAYLQTNVTEVTSGSVFSGSAGSLTGASGVTSVQVGKAELAYASGNGGMFAAVSGGETALNLEVTSGGYLTLSNGGTAGTVTLNNKAVLYVNGNGQKTEFNGNVSGSNDVDNYSAFIVNGDTTVNGNITSAVEVGSGSSLTSGFSGSGGTAPRYNISSTLVVVRENASLITNNLTMTSGGSLNVVGGSVVAEGTIALDLDNVIADGAVVKANTVSGNSATQDKELWVGFNIDESAKTGSTPVYKSSSGTLEVTKLDLNDSRLHISSSAGSAASVVAVQHFADVNNNNVGLMDGMVNVGRNSIIGVGVNSAAELKSTLAGYIGSNGSLKPDGYGAIFYLGGKNLRINASGAGLVLTSDALRTEGTTKGFQDQDYTSSNFGLTNAGIENGIYFGKNTALIIDQAAIADPNTAVIRFNGSGSKVVAAGGEVIILGTDLKAGTEFLMFTDQDQQETTGKYAGVDIVSADGQTIPEDANSENGLTVKTANGVLTYTMNGSDRSHVTLALNKNYRQSLNGSSSAVADTIAQYVSQEAASFTSHALLKTVAYNSNGAMAEKAARLALYGGAVEVALSANQAYVDAVSSRMGMGHQNSVLSFADNADGAGVWLVPVYRNHDSDSFDAQGVDYGVNMDLNGLSMGADYTFAQNFRAGAVLNVGSASVDGQGAASGVSNDASFWGVGVYGGYYYNNLSVVADIGYSLVDNEIDLSTGLSDISKMYADTDSAALSVGLTAQYKFALAMADLTPHIGMRYTRVTMDDYTVKSNVSDMAKFDAGNINVFSIPVGLSLSKTFMAGGWTLMPAVDVVVTANCGDTDFDGDASWTGLQNFVTATSTDVLDRVTYGINAGLSAMEDGFSIGIGVNYTGSESADESSVQADVRYMF